MQSQITIYSLEEDKRDSVLDGVDHALLEAILRSLRIKAILYCITFLLAVRAFLRGWMSCTAWVCRAICECDVQCVDVPWHACVLGKMKYLPP